MIIHGDATKIPLADNSIDTCITDPPYGLGFMGKEWDTFDKSQFGIAGNEGENDLKVKKNFKVLPRYNNGAGLYDFTLQWATEVFRVLKPGGLLLAFGGTRTYHRLACAIEDAGFEIRDTIAWIYGSGFPKSYDISKGIDKQAGAEREVIGKYELPDVADGLRKKSWDCTNTTMAGMFGVSGQNNLTAPSTPEAQLWDGWGTALKPAFEPIVVAMKPVDGNFVNNALTWGVAGMWIDGGRVGTEGGETHSGGWQDTMVGGKVINGGVKADYTPQGRFPANLIHDGSDEVLEVFPETKSGSGNKGGHNTTAFFGSGSDYDAFYNSDSGSASRFFYCAKASRAERNAGLENNGHPTVKPIALMRYLVRLTKTPTGGVVLDPFMGSGTTGCACALEGRDFIGIEKEAEYIEIAQKRIAYWSQQPKLPVE